MTIDEAIARLRAEAELQRKYAKEIRERTKNSNFDYGKAEEQCAEEYEQLAEWLEELKAIKDGSIPIIHGNAELELHDKAIRNKAIDEFIELLKGNLIRKYANANITQQYVALQVTDWCNEIAEQLKGGGE